jgi:hypothetical protein
MTSRPSPRLLHHSVGLQPAIIARVLNDPQRAHVTYAILLFNIRVLRWLTRVPGKQPAAT